MQISETLADAANGQHVIGGLRAVGMRLAVFTQKGGVEMFPVLARTSENALDVAIGVRLCKRGIEAGEVFLGSRTHGRFLKPLLFAMASHLTVKRYSFGLAPGPPLRL